MDLFKSKREQLLGWMEKKGFFYTHEVIQWSLDNFYISADRVKRTFLEKGNIRKLSKKEKSLRNFTNRDAVYEFVRRD